MNKYPALLLLSISVSLTSVNTVFVSPYSFTFGLVALFPCFGIVEENSTLQLVSNTSLLPWQIIRWTPNRHSQLENVHATYTESNHPIFPWVRSVRSNFHSNSPPPSITAALWKRLLRECFPGHCNLNCSIVIFPPYPHDLHFLPHALSFISHASPLLFWL